MKQLIDILRCNKCYGSFKKRKDKLICKVCGMKYGYENEILEAMPKVEGEKKFSKNKWDKYYENWFKNKDYWEEFEKTKDIYEIYGAQQIERETDINRETIYLEIGCGTFYIGQLLAKKCELVIGIDFSLESLQIARKMLRDKGVKNFILIHGDIFNIPIHSNKVDVIYGGGVIEHFENTQDCINEYGRVLKKGGVALNAVPILNIGALTYRQIWGNIPDLPIIKEIFKWVHIKLLKAKHMHFGYELSFPRKKLIKMHDAAKFSNTIIKRLDTKIMLDFLPEKIRPVLRKLAKECVLFWPMGLVVATK